MEVTDRQPSTHADATERARFNLDIVIVRKEVVTASVRSIGPKARYGKPPDAV